MLRLSSNSDEEYYAYLYKLIYAIANINPNYNWLITDFEAYPQIKCYQTLIMKKKYLIMSTKKLVKMLKQDNFQWIWGIFSAIPNRYSEKEILDYALPHIEENDQLVMKHPLAEIEIGIVDSSSLYIISNNEYIEVFKTLYPKAE